MKRALAGTTNRLVLLGTALVVVVAAISFAQPGATKKQPPYDGKKNGIRLLFGGGKDEKRDKTEIDETKLNNALALVDDSAFIVKYYKDATTLNSGWPKGKLSDVNMAELTRTSETGGGTDPAIGATADTQTRTVGNATQIVTFQSTTDLTAFTDQLK